ncbi:indolepyruvate ferredoxin oxidoreductase family protein [Janthinobacterium sp. 17J80-10]|uniref:indolepyruvate ferredoxin oxidoreductase family protein n=1 Tax=Janthinobacterium sp. 17J80-10 TaxID=2497863 RepID=UPI0010059CB1|nr:indolepyruvate ferredoxin oxidoreductase family protein [Janthinobacterium sp. 17J80-10]QAU33304.1 indolepyruvate ferredoxin oxidoreductase family protein [Janthinobacterium sp. 17J80-10]
MNAPLLPGQALVQAPRQDAISLDDKFTLARGRAFLTGTQALVRLPMLQHQRDQAAGLNTAGYISGYRGSPLGNVDLTAMKAQKHLEAHQVKFHPGMNEDLAATAVWGTQQVNLFPGAQYEGVFSLWYGKGPGVDRCGDVFKHANMAGSSAHGGVLLAVGDDHAAKSSTTAHQSEHILKACGIPVLYPASVQEYLDYGLHGWAMSRYTGLWVAMKCVTDLVESGAVVDLDPDRVQIALPEDFALPPGGLNIRWPDAVLEQEARMNNFKWYAALAYARRNRLNRIVWDSPRAKIGIITAGKSYLDTRQALADLGIDEDVARDIGIRLYKVGMTWPLEAEGVRDFAQGLEEILVVEEKRQLLEYQLKEELYNWRDDVRPRVVGKFDDSGEWSNPHREGHGHWLLPATYELSPAQIARAIASRISKYFAGHPVEARVRERIAYLEAKDAVLQAVSTAPNPATDRLPHFCSGCPHNTSTNLPTGSRALAGIGCHYMVLWMDRETSTFTHMGAEGATWIGHAPFTNEPHVFANLGDGTYFHSGILAIRAAVAAQVNITYKVLYNDAVAMTGGQHVDGPLDPARISRQLAAEGVTPIVVITDEPDKYPDGTEWAAGVVIRHRRELDDVQRELREVRGVSAVIYDQTCAAEKRRRRKQHAYPDPARRVVINESVCEGCGDCSVKSNCLSVEPLETPFGRKRQINQSSCNKDYSCLEGFCPSFVTVEGGALKRPAPVKGALVAGAQGASPATSLPLPALPAAAVPFNILVCGIGGTGVITIGQILAMAAHIEGKGCTVLDMSGLAQKGGPVMSHVRICERQDALFSTRVGTGMADLVIGCDVIVAAGRDALTRMGEGKTHAAVNTTGAPTSAFIRNPDWQYPGASAEEQIRTACGRERVDFINAGHVAATLMGDTIATNMFMLGYAWQKGWVPLGLDALVRAIELNAVSVEFNRQAFAWGRHAACDLAAVEKLARTEDAAAHVIEFKRNPRLDDVIALRVEFLTAYQNAAYAQQYRDFVEEVRTAENRLGHDGRAHRLTDAVARYLFKLMAYKDEYEVARLHADPAFREKIAGMFEGDYKIKYHLAPPLMAKRDARGHLVKREYGPWMLQAFRLLAPLKRLRGSALDVFGYTQERRTERALIGQYRQTIASLLPKLHADKLALAVAIASIPETIRGYGHIKEHNLREAREKEATLLTAFHAPVAPMPAPADKKQVALT